MKKIMTLIMLLMGNLTIVGMDIVGMDVEAQAKRSVMFNPTVRFYDDDSDIVLTDNEICVPGAKIIINYPADIIESFNCDDHSNIFIEDFYDDTPSWSERFWQQLFEIKLLFLGTKTPSVKIDKQPKYFDSIEEATAWFAEHPRKTSN